jgi:hypothetical protein
MPESMVWNIIKGKVSLPFCGLQTSARTRSVTMIEIEHILTVDLELQTEMHSL